MKNVNDETCSDSLVQNAEQEKMQKKTGIKKAVSLKKCNYERHFGLTQCGSAG